MRILFVDPWIHDFAAFDLWANPTGLLTLAAHLRARGAEVSVIDCLHAPDPAMAPPRRNPDGTGSYLRTPIKKPAVFSAIPRRWCRYGVSPETFRSLLKQTPRPDAICVSSLMTYWCAGVEETIRIIRETLPGIPVILGGIYATLCPEHARATSGADHVLTGPGEQSLPELLSRLTGESLPPLNTTPPPAHDLLRDRPSATILTSRGCPFSCTYCASHRLYPGFTHRSREDVLREIITLHEQGIRHLSFADDALLMDAEHFIIPLLSEIRRRDMHLSFHCPNALHARCITPALAELMAATGFTTIRLGFETADAARQQASGGKVNNTEFAAATEALHRAGYNPTEIGTYLLCGLPGQYAHEVDTAIDFVHDHGALPLLAEYSPIPGTPLFEDAVAASPFPLTTEPLCHNNSILPCRWTHQTLEDYQALKQKTRTLRRGEQKMPDGFSRGNFL